MRLGGAALTPTYNAAMARRYLEGLEAQGVSSV
jgi:hypothetical protein